MSKHRTSEGTPRLASVVVFGNHDESTVLGLTASLMLALDDPLATALLDAAALADREPHRTNHFRVIDGKGVVGSVNGHAIAVGNASLFSDHGLSLGDFENWDVRLSQQGQRVVFVAVDGELAAFLSISKSESSKNIHQDTRFEPSGSRKD
jgi:Cu+-exporting ATPase